MIQVYDWNNQNYDRNGNMVIEPTECVISQTLNEAYTLSLTHPIDELGRWKYLKVRNKILVPAPNGQTELFEIDEVTKTEDGVTVIAEQVFYKCRDVALDIKVSGMTPLNYLKRIFSNSLYTVTSDIVQNAGGSFDWTNSNCLKALNGDDEEQMSFRQAYGGDLYINKYNLHVTNTQIKKGRILKLREDLDEIEEHIDYKNTVTRVYPKSIDGFGLVAPIFYVDSDFISVLGVREKCIVYDDLFMKAEEDDDGYLDINLLRAELLSRASREFNDNDIDKPIIECRVNLRDLRKLDCYKDFKFLEDVALGEYVKVLASDLEIDCNARVVSYDYDCILEKYNSITLGNVRKYLFDEEKETIKYMQTQINTFNKLLNHNATGFKTTTLRGKLDATMIGGKLSNNQLPSLIEGNGTKIDLTTGAITNGLIKLDSNGLKNGTDNFVSQIHTQTINTTLPLSSVTKTIKTKLPDKFAGKNNKITFTCSSPGAIGVKDGKIYYIFGFVDTVCTYLSATNEVQTVFTYNTLAMEQSGLYLTIQTTPSVSSLPCKLDLFVVSN